MLARIITDHKVKKTLPNRSTLSSTLHSALCSDSELLSELLFEGFMSCEQLERNTTLSGYVTLIGEAHLTSSPEPQCEIRS